MDPIKFIQAKNFTPVPASAPRTVDLVVIHTMEAVEKPGTALNVARWFAGATAPQASAHYCVDDSTVIACVREEDVAWAAPGANKNGIHIEHAGFAAQKAADWNDAYSQAMLARSAELSADILKRHGIPLIRLEPGTLIGGGRGICGHIDITNAFNNGKGHTDPGPSFPWEQYLDLILAAMGPAVAPENIAVSVQEPEPVV